MTASFAGIRVNNLEKSFGPARVLAGCNLTIQPRESMVLIGQSGGGKSVLLRCILGLTPYDHGTVQIGAHHVGNESPGQQEARFADSGVVFQSYALFDSLTVWENVAFRVPGTPSERRNLAIDILKRVALEPAIADLAPSALSGGMKRRVSIARAIALRPKFLFFDEPTEGLDPVLSATISALIRQVVTELQATALTITHSMKNAQIIGDQVALLDGGKIVHQLPSSRLLTDSFPLLQRFVRGQTLNVT